MSDPYRDSSGTACPRCHGTMIPDAAGDLTCGDGCGAWMERRAVTSLLGTVDLGNSGAVAPFFKVAALPATRCVTCNTALVAHYRVVARGFATFGECNKHGLWIERGTRALFESAFSAAIARHRQDEAHRELPVETRIERLEAQVVALTARLVALEQSVASRD